MPINASLLIASVFTIAKIIQLKKYSCCCLIADIFLQLAILSDDI